MQHTDHTLDLPSVHKLSVDELLSALVADDLITQDNADECSRLVRSRNKPDIHPLVQIAGQQIPGNKTAGKPLTLEQLTQWLAEYARLPYERIDPLKVDVTAVTDIIPYAYAAKNGILPVRVSLHEVTIATSEPFKTEIVQDLERTLGKNISLVMVNPDDLERYRIEFYNLSRSVLRASDEADKQRTGGIQNLEQLVELGRSGKLDANDHHVVSIVDWLLQYAYEQRASDIHMEPRRDKGHVRFRIDGVLHYVYELPPSVMAAVTSRLKILGRMDLAEKRRPQDGRIKTKGADNGEIELRLSTMPTAFGEKLVMRIFDPEVLVKDYAELGLSTRDVTTWESMITHPHGIILVTGPTGSGKTTTLYTSLKQLAKPEVNICTVEDPIEMVEPDFNQMQVQSAIDLTFSSGIRTLLRQDPDIIMVGEIRDLETAEMAVQASLTGHLVLSTLHTNDSISALTRLREIGVQPYLIKASLIGVMAQRLVRTLCPHCKKEGVISDEDWHALVHPWKAAKPKKVYVPEGCLECRNTGFLGRTGVYELFQIDDSLRNMLTDNFDVAEIRKHALKQGLHPLRICGAEKVNAGITTVDEILRVVPPEEEGMS